MSSKAEHAKPKIKTEELEDIKPNIKTEYMDTTAEDMNESKDQIYSELSKNVNAIAKPLASRKLCKGLYRITGKGICF